MTELRLLGPAEIRNEQGELEHSFLAGPKRLALLSYLLLARPRGFHRRDSLLPVFWPDFDQKSARNALSNMLFHIRKTLGKEAVENRGSEEISLNPEVFWCDVLHFEKAIAAQDYECALELYRSELLKGFYVQDISIDFEQWLEQERKRIHDLALKANKAFAEVAAEKRDFQKAVFWTRKASEWEPFSEPIHLKLVELLYETGDQKAALQTAEKFARQVRAEFEEEPGLEFLALQEKVKKGKPALSPASKNATSSQVSSASIAVLPFETLGYKKASAFTDAIHADILTRLSQVSDLLVISRTSVQSFRGTEKLLPQVGKELQVKWLLTGEVQEINQHVKVSVRLVLAAEDRQLWAESYEQQTTADNIFHIQAEITRNIIASLEMRLSRGEKKAIKHIPTEDLEAFRLQAHGRWNLDKRTEEGMRLAEENFRRSIEQDPNYAEAWLGLADTLSLIHDYNYEKDERGILAEAEAAAHTALRLDPDLAEAYASLGLLYATRRKAEAAISNFKKTVQLRPGYAEAHAWLSWILQLTGHAREGLECAKRAVTTNPLSQEAISNLSLSWLTCGDYTAAILEAKRLLLLQPDFDTAHLQAGLALYHAGKYEEASDTLEGIKVPWAGNGAVVTRILSCLKMGNDPVASVLMNEISLDRFAQGLLEAYRGNLEEAIILFESIENWDYWEILSIYYLYPEILGPVRKDQRFRKILQTINLCWGLDPQKLPLLPSLTTRPNEEKELLLTKVANESRAANSLVVMPFKDLTGREPQLIQGIHGDIVISLAGVKGLQVISRSSAQHYERDDKTATRIGEELHVNWLLEGEVEVEEDAKEFKVHLHLIRTQTSTLVWTHNYKKELTAKNIFLLREDITQDILKVLEIAPQKEVPVSQPTANLAAYRLYVQGRSCLDQRTEQGIFRGLDCFQGAMEADPEYALAWSGIADAVSLLFYYGFSIPRNSPDPVEAAQRAVELSPQLSEAYVALGIAYSMKQDGPASLEAFERAVQLSPGHAEALIWLGWLYLILGRPKEGLAPGIQAVRLDPLAPAMRVFLAEIYLSNGYYQEALSEATRGREINPEYALAHYMEGLAHYHQQNYKAAAAAFERALEKIHGRGTPSPAEVKTALAFSRFALGEQQQAIALKTEIFGRIDPFPLGMLQALNGEIDAAFHSFEKVRDWSSFSTEILRYLFPEALQKIRHDQRYPSLIKNLDAAWKIPEAAKSLQEKRGSLQQG